MKKGYFTTLLALLCLPFASMAQGTYTQGFHVGSTGLDWTIDVAGATSPTFPNWVLNYTSRNGVNRASGVSPSSSIAIKRITDTAGVVLGLGSIEYNVPTDQQKVTSISAWTRSNNNTQAVRILNVIINDETRIGSPIDVPTQPTASTTPGWQEFKYDFPTPTTVTKIKFALDSTCTANILIDEITITYDAAVSTKKVTEDQTMFFPNPFSSELVFKGTKEGKVTIFAANGQAVHSQAIVPGQTVSANLAKGMYIARLVAGDKESWCKLIKQ